MGVMSKLHHNQEHVVICVMACRFFFLVFLAWSTAFQATAQTDETSADVEFYFDSNIGVAFVDFHFLAPLCWEEYPGCRIRFVFEAEAGLAFPTVATGKVGVGLQRFEVVRQAR